MTDMPARRARPRQLLQRMLEEPAIVEAVQSLPASTLGAVVRHVGLEDAGELIALCTTAQLQDLLDDDIWHALRPGQKEQFVPERFGTWLNVLHETGARFAAEKLAALDEDFLVLALSELVVVVDFPALEQEYPQLTQDDELDTMLSNALSLELDAFTILARDGECWDALVDVLMELDAHENALLRRLLTRLAYQVERELDDTRSLNDVLSTMDMLSADVGGDRDDRREAAGFVPASSASAFLGLCRVTSADALLRETELDPVTRGHFRVLRPPAPEVRISSASLQDLLDDAEVQRHVRLLPEGTVVLPFQDAITHLDDKTRQQRMLELTYLANVLVQGCTVHGRAFRPVESLDAVLSCCNLGFQRLPNVKDHSAVQLFKIGFHHLHHDVVMTVARSVVGVLKGEAQKRMQRDMHAGKPWLAREVLVDVEPIVLALLDQFPALPGRAPRFLRTEDEIRSALDQCARALAPGRTSGK